MQRDVKSRFSCFLRRGAIAALLMALSHALTWNATDTNPQAKRLPTENDRIPASKLREDLDILQQTLEQANPGLYRHTSKPELDKAFKTVQQALRAPITAIEFFRLVAPLSATIRDGHTQFGLPLRLQEEAEKHWPILPLQVYLLRSKLFVVRDLASPERLPAGSEILKIGDVGTPELVKKMLTMAPRDGRVQSSPPWWLNHDFRFGMLLAIITGPRTRYRVTYVRPHAQSPETLDLDGVPRDELQQRVKREARASAPPPTADLRFQDSGAVALLTVRAFAHDVGQRAMADFFNEAFRRIREQGSASLIIDVRDNGGGWDDLGKLLLAHLVDHPFQYYAGIYVERTSFAWGPYVQPIDALKGYRFEPEPRGGFRLASHPNFGTQLPAEPLFHGKVFVLMNGGSFSTTAEFLSNTHFLKRATFVGEEAGGGYLGDNGGEFIMLTLPHSLVSVHIPLMRYELPLRSTHPDRGVMPDVSVSPTLDDIINGQDPVMARALHLAADSEGGGITPRDLCELPGVDSPFARHRFLRSTGHI